MAWDTVTRSMLPDEELFDKPIELRNECIFYLGHIPAFLDIQLTKTTKDPPTEPAAYHSIFERGIDPDVDNPENCHAHSAVPDAWPPVNEILQYQSRVRSRLRKLYSAGLHQIGRDVARGMWVGFEHELMHLETLLYMMLQSDKTLPPPHAPRPDFKALAEEAFSRRTANEWFDIPEQELIIGLDDPENDAVANTHFGWYVGNSAMSITLVSCFDSDPYPRDNEKPARRARVHGFQAKGRAITNEEVATMSRPRMIQTDCGSTHNTCTIRRKQRSLPPGRKSHPGKIQPRATG